MNLSIHSYNTRVCALVVASKIVPGLSGCVSQHRGCEDSLEGDGATSESRGAVDTQEIEPSAAPGD